MGNVWRDLWPIYFGHWATPNIRLILRYKPHINGCTCTPLFDKIGPTNIAIFPVVLEKSVACPVGHQLWMCCELSIALLFPALKLEKVSTPMLAFSLFWHSEAPDVGQHRRRPTKLNTHT